MGLQVVQQPPALAYQHQQAAARRMILRVGFEMLSQVANTLAENRDLHLRTASVAVMSAETRDNFGFLLGCQHVRAYSSAFSLVHFLSVWSKNNMAGLARATFGRGFGIKILPPAGAFIRFEGPDSTRRRSALAFGLPGLV